MPPPFRRRGAHARPTTCSGGSTAFVEPENLQFGVTAAQARKHATYEAGAHYFSGVQPFSQRHSIAREDGVS